MSISSFGVLADGAPILSDGEAAKILVEQSANLIISQYKDEKLREELYEKTLMKLMEEHPELIEDAYRAMFSELDEHTTYYTTEEYNYFTESMDGEISGIGVVVTMLPEGLLVTETTAESPAAQAGVKQGDIIVTVDGQSIVGMSLEMARSFVIGPIGSPVRIGVLRDGGITEFTITRQPVVIEPGSYQILDGKVGYIELQTFDASAPVLVNNALDAFDKEGITNIIFDLRYNPGGSVEALVDICQRIIPKGPVIHFEFQNEEENITLYSECTNPKYSLIVLVNEYSASASEAFAGAVQDSGIGFVMGETTYGKGTMQNLINFRIGGGVKMTVAEYLTRDKRHIDGEGIKPDYYETDKMIRMKGAGLNDFDFNTDIKIGDKNTFALALNERLWALGYDVGIPTDEFTEKTKRAVITFQGLNNMEPTGICDWQTQVNIENAMQKHEFSNNKCFKSALHIFKSGTFNLYMKEIKKKK